MLIMDAVLESYVTADFALWPVAEPPANRLLPLSGQLSSGEVGTAMAVLTTYNKGPRERRPRPVTDRVVQVRRLVTAEYVIAPGGLRVHDTTTAVTASPGCCSGLEDWREWLDLLNGNEPWLGHGSGARAEVSGDIVRLWPDAERPEGPTIDVPLAQLPELMHSVQEKLIGFLTSVEEWAIQYAPPLAATVMEKLDASFTITAQLPTVEG